MHSRIFQLSMDNPLAEEDYITQSSLSWQTENFADYIVDLETPADYESSISWFSTEEDIVVEKDLNGLSYFTADDKTMQTLEKVFIAEIAEIRRITQEATKDLRAGKGVHLASRVTRVMSEVGEFRYSLVGYSEEDLSTREDLYNHLCNHRGKRFYFAGILDYHI